MLRHAVLRPCGACAAGEAVAPVWLGAAAHHLWYVEILAILTGEWAEAKIVRSPGGGSHAQHEHMQTAAGGSKSASCAVR